MSLRNLAKAESMNDDTRIQTYRLSIPMSIAKCSARLPCETGK